METQSSASAFDMQLHGLFPVESLLSVAAPESVAEETRTLRGYKYTLSLFREEWYSESPTPNSDVHERKKDC